MKTFKIRFLSALLAILMIASMLPLMFITGSAAGGEQVTKTVNLFNSGATGSGRYYSSTQGRDANPAPSTINNNGYDLYGQMYPYNTLTFRVGLSFKIEETVAAWAKLTVYAYDVDEEDGERDIIYLVDETDKSRTEVGTLSGRNNQWNTTTLEIDPSNFEVGHTYHFENMITSARSGPQWYVYIRRLSIELTTNTDPNPDDPIVPPVTDEPKITDHKFSASISNSGYVSTTLNMTTDKDATYNLEYSAVIGAEQKGSALNQSIQVTPNGATKTVGFQLESGSKKGTYQINVVISDAKGNTITTYSATAGYAYSAVTYDPNGGSTNVPKDTTAYSAGNTVKVRFDRIPYKSGYNFLGWSTYRDTKSPAAVEGGALFYFKSLGGTSFTVTDAYGNSETINATLDMANGKVSFVDQYGTSYVFTYTVNGYTVSVTDKTGCTASAEVIEMVKNGMLPQSATVRVNPEFVIGNSDVTLYAVWQEIPVVPPTPTYTVTYDANGGKGVPVDSKAYEAGEEVDVLFKPVPVKDGETFLGWSIYPDTNSPIAVMGGTTFQFKNNGGLNFTVTDSFGHSETATAKMDFVNNTVFFTDKYGTTYTFGYEANRMNITIMDKNGCYASADITDLQMDVTGKLPASATVTVQPKFNMGNSNVTLYAIWKQDKCDPHNYKLIKNTATCTAAGIKLYECVNCGDQVEQKISAFGHDYKLVDSKPATCQNMGYEHYECSRCKDSYVVNLSALPHVEGEHTITKQPTCTEPGSWTALCEVCKTELNGYLAPLGHNIVRTVRKQVTCTEPGIIAYECTREGCTYERIEYIYSEHTFVQSERVEATCTVDGKIVYTCSKCNATREEVIKGGHQYEGKVTKAATLTEEGIITYTCVKCGDSYIETFSGTEANILLVEDRLPWTSVSNSTLLKSLQKGGYISAWSKTTTANLANLDLSLYDVIYIANDQSTATYNQLKKFNEAIEAFVRNGGIVVYGACDHGWAGGNISYALPGGVTKGNYYSYRNYISNHDHDIVTGVLTDGKALTNTLLYHNYSSHTYFTNLPADAVTILTDANGNPTLVEYPLGDGYVIASGLTWEHAYERIYMGSSNYSKTVYDDLLVYAASLICQHDWITGETVAPTCTEDGYTSHRCNKCGAIRKTNFVPALGHVEGEWVVVKEATPTEWGYKELMCSRCNQKIRGEEIPTVEGPVANVTVPDNTVIVGDYITFIVKIENADLAKNLGIEWIFDESVFTYEEENYEFLLDSLIQNFEEDTYRAAFAWTDPTDINVKDGVFALTLKASAITDPASTVVTCRVLLDNGKIEIKVIPVTVTVIGCPHDVTYGKEMDDTCHAIICERCDFVVGTQKHVYADCCDETCNVCTYVRVAPHDKVAMPAVAPTCTKTGLTEGLKCRKCGVVFVKQEVVPMIPHTEEIIPAVPATCEKDGLSEGVKCSVCKKILVSQVKDPARGHKYKSVVTAPTCTEEGYTTYTCKNPNCERPTYVDNYVDPLGHDYKSEVTKEATCVEKGVKTYTCQRVDCNHSETDEIPALGHDYKAVVTAPTCTEKGYTTYICQRDNCKHTYVDIYVPELGHNFAPEWAHDENAHWHACTRCGVADEKLDHIYDAANDGKCDECGYVRFIRGDMDQDGDVDSDDSIYLLYYVMFKGVGYPINQPADMDGNNKVNVNDAVYLLNSIIFGSTDYPLF